MQSTLKHCLREQTLVLLGDRALFWEEKKILVVADIHLGKANAFRKAGIPVPPGSTATDLERLSHLLEYWKPRRLIFLGDLVHGPIDDPRIFIRHVMVWRDHHRSLQLLLATGNHDRRAVELLTAFRFDGIASEWVIPPFRFSHRPQPEGACYGIAGHLHPAVRVTGKSRQRETLPCFSFGSKGALMPAFGSFTGTQTIRPSLQDRVVVVAEGTLIDMRPQSFREKC